MSESDSSSSSLQPTITEKSKSKTSTKNKSKTNSAANPTSEDDPTWAYQPPEGMSILEDAEVDEGWDWDTLEKDPELQLWVIRVPSGVKPKHLQNLAIDLSGPSSNRYTKVGALNRKQESYDIWNLGSSSTSDGNFIGGVEVGRTDVEAVAGGGEEIRGLTCLLPRKKKRGQLFIAPRPIARHLIISAQPIIPSSSDISTETATLTQNPPRFSYPQELLKHRFVAFGSTKNTNAEDAHYGDGDDDIQMEDVHMKSDKLTQKTTEKVSKQSKESKKRKKAEDAAMPTPKKQKKSKK
ncbi:hypothetical protein GGU11DRAFT_708705 [Lentinula aff. detonsa]|uniref:Uncharacterized protein n=1 Tax=Lentinula aff. detonsa TaxID=2804958 RepID=A0AA38NL47_9AGAR|nr:hypothetical protein GGU10DRAFT_307377 [Lentinula aff. detonsa]KAJ3795774.1 hypothetical protein GGU11DRAFT_708705 [Lentinula aff. detonsa]